MTAVLLSDLLLIISLTANAVTIGAPTWVFFIQSPTLLDFMGRSKFIPPMMELTKVLFHWTLVLSSIATVTTSYLAEGPIMFASIAVAAVTVNAVLIVPRALAPHNKLVRPRPYTKADFTLAGAEHQQGLRDNYLVPISGYICRSHASRGCRACLRVFATCW